jgi:hypothetical protein
VESGGEAFHSTEVCDFFSVLVLLKEYREGEGLLGLGEWVKCTRVGRFFNRERNLLQESEGFGRKISGVHKPPNPSTRYPTCKIWFQVLSGLTPFICESVLRSIPHTSLPPPFSLLLDSGSVPKFTSSTMTMRSIDYLSNYG